MHYLGPDGRLIAESLRDYSKKNVLQTYQSLDGFLTAWAQADRKQALLDELQAQGVFLDDLAKAVGSEYDAFDLVCHVAWGQPPLTRQQRADRVKKRDVFTLYGEQARSVLTALLDKYAKVGIGPVETTEILKVAPLPTFGTPVEILGHFGGRDGYLKALDELEKALYLA